MQGNSYHRFKEDRPFASPEAAARKLIEIATAEMTATGQPHAYTGTWNSSFTRAGGSIAEYGDGRDFGIAKGWFSIDGVGDAVSTGTNSPPST